MKEQIYIEVKNKQQVAGNEDDMLDVSSKGVLYQKRGHYYLVYKDFSEGLNGARTTIKIDPENEKVLLSRATPAELKQSFRSGEKTTGFYKIRSEKMKLEIETDNIDLNFYKDGGKIRIKYRIYFGGKLATTNDLLIKYTKEGVE